MELTKQQEKLFEIVKHYHDGQVRKYTGNPYHTHLYDVAELVSPHVVNTIEIALCHDLFEDTKCTPRELSNHLTQDCNYSLGYATSIVNGVKNLTDVFTHEQYPSMNRAERKLNEVHRLSYISGDCQSIKYADLIDNTHSIVLYDPSFSKIYVPEAIELLNRLRRGNIYLLLQLASILEDARNTVRFQD